MTLFPYTTLFRSIVSNLHSPKEEIERNDVKININQILDSSTSCFLSKRELKDIRASIATISKWDNIKRGGSSALPSGQPTKSFKDMDQILKKSGIYIVPVGELECFIKEVGGHGPEWSNKVLETYPDLNNEVYDGIKKFVKEFSS